MVVLLYAIAGVLITPRSSVEGKSICLPLASLANLEKNCKLKESQTPGPRICLEGPEVKCYGQLIPASHRGEEPGFPLTSSSPALFGVSVSCQPGLVALSCRGNLCMPGVSGLTGHFLRSLFLFLGNSELHLPILLGFCLLPEGAIAAARDGVR